MQDAMNYGELSMLTGPITATTMPNMSSHTADNVQGCRSLVDVDVLAPHRPHRATDRRPRYIPATRRLVARQGA